MQLPTLLTAFTAIASLVPGHFASTDQNKAAGRRSYDAYGYYDDSNNDYGGGDCERRRHSSRRQYYRYRRNEDAAKQAEGIQDANQVQQTGAKDEAEGHCHCRHHDRCRDCRDSIDGYGHHGYGYGGYGRRSAYRHNRYYY